MIEKTFPTLQYDDINFLTGQVETVNLILPLDFRLTLPDGITIDATGLPSKVITSATLNRSVSFDGNPLDSEKNLF